MSVSGKYQPCLEGIERILNILHTTQMSHCQLSKHSDP